MRIPSTILVCSLMVLLLAGPSASAADKDIIQLQNDVVKLQQTVQELQKSVDARNVELLSRLDKTADQMNNLTVSVQKIADMVGTIKADNAAAAASAAKSASDTREAIVPLIGQLQKSVGDLGPKITGIENQFRSLSEQIIAMKSTSTPLPTCKDLKQAADRSFNSNYLDDAVSGYRDFLSTPTCINDVKAGEVQFLIAESLFNSKKFDQAVNDYDIFLAKYPGHDKTSSALLRKGLAYVELKQIPEARKAFTSVTTEFKGTSEATLAAAKLKEIGPAPATTGRGARGQ